MAGTPNVGTLVGAAIRPINTADLISTAYANEIKGGIHGYATISERDSIIIQRRQWGMLCTVYDDPNPLNNKTYQLKYNNFDTDLMNLLNWVEYTGVSTTSITEWQNSVKSILTTVPTSPSDKDRYLVGIDQSSTIFGSPWAGNPGGFISEYDVTTTNWTNTYPTNGMTIRVDDQDNSLYKYEGTYSTGKWDKEKLTQVYSTDFTGNGINYATTTTPGFISYDIDTIFLSKFDVTNTGTIVKLDINGIGLLDVKKPSINGLIDLYPGEIQPDNIYSLVYDQDNNCFQFFKNYSSDSINIKYYIEPTDYIVVPPFCQYWIYGDLTVGGTIVNYGKIIVANGQLIIGASGSVENFGEVDLITIGSGNTNGNTVSTTQSLQSVTDNGNTTSNVINANGGIQGSTDYSSYAIGTSFHNEMKYISLQINGNGTDFPVNSGCRLYMDPEEGLSLVRFYENSGNVLYLGEDEINLNSSTRNAGSNLSVSPNRLYYRVRVDGEVATLYFNRSEGLAFATNTINKRVCRLKSDFLTLDRTLQVPDNSGTIALTSDISTATTSLYNSIIKQTVINGVTSSTPSQDAVYDFVTSTVASATTENFSHYIFNMSNFIIEYGVSTFEIGKYYQIPNVKIGDDFTNIGYVGREPFMATGITPSSFLNGTTVNNINPLLTYKVYKNSNAISFDKIFDIDNNLMIALNITNPTSSILSSLLIEGGTSITAGKSVYYDTDINKLIIAGYDTNIDLKVFNIEINSATYSLV